MRAERDERQSFHRVFADVLEQLDDLASREEVRWHDLMAFVLSWALRRRPKEENRELARVAKESLEHRLNEKEVTIMSQVLGQSYESWLLEKGEAQGIVKGIERGIEKGKAEGKAEGELSARRDDLRELLMERFGELPAEVLRKIDSAVDATLLKAAIRKAVHVKSLDELDL